MLGPGPGVGPTTWLYSSTGPLYTSEHPDHRQGNICWEEVRGGVEEGLGWVASFTLEELCKRFSHNEVIFVHNDSAMGKVIHIW